jgi:hypothetical protein
MAKNMCYVDEPSEIADELLYSENIQLDDCITAIIGLAKIVERQQGEINDLKKAINCTKA